MSRRAAPLIALTAVLLATAPTALGQRPPQAVEQARAYFGDTELVDQDGETVRFYSDLLDGKVVVIDSMFTTCSAICPVLGQKMQRLQEAAGDRLGDDVHLISITVDPKVDTPAKLRAYGERFGAKEGWYFLTGSPENVERVLAKLGYAVEDKDDHSTIVLMGNEKTGLWKKTNGLSSSDELVKLFRDVLNDSGPPADGARGSR